MLASENTHGRGVLGSSTHSVNVAWRRLKSNEASVIHSWPVAIPCLPPTLCEAYVKPRLRCGYQLRSTFLRVSGAPGLSGRRRPAWRDARAYFGPPSPLQPPASSPPPPPATVPAAAAAATVPAAAATAAAAMPIMVWQKQFEPGSGATRAGAVGLGGLARVSLVVCFILRCFVRWSDSGLYCMCLEWLYGSG